MTLSRLLRTWRSRPVVDASASVPVSSIGDGLELRGVGRRAGVIPGVDNGGRAEMYAYVNAEDGCPIPQMCWSRLAFAG